jgi:ribosome-binding protein aMBF1 (putative translation factor)
MKHDNQTPASNTRTISAATKAKLKALRGAPERAARITNPQTMLETTPAEIEEHIQEYVIAQKVGELLRLARNARKLSTRALGAKVGVSQPRVTAVEQASTDLELDTLARFASGLGYRVVVQLLPEGEPGPVFSADLPSSRHS